MSRCLYPVCVLIYRCRKGKGRRRGAAPEREEPEMTTETAATVATTESLEGLTYETVGLYLNKRAAEAAATKQPHELAVGDIVYMNSGYSMVLPTFGIVTKRTPCTYVIEELPTCSKAEHSNSRPSASAWISTTSRAWSFPSSTAGPSAEAGAALAPTASPRAATSSGTASTLPTGTARRTGSTPWTSVLPHTPYKRRLGRRCR